MSPKRICPKGFITFHTPIHRGLFLPENYTIDSQVDVKNMKSPSQPMVRLNLNSKSKREGSNEAYKSTKSTQPHRLERRSCPSLRRLQAKMDTENHQMKETMELLLNTEMGFVKLEDVLNQHDIAEQRRRELLHKDWTEHIWMPLQKHLNQHVSSCGAMDIKRRQGLYSQYLQHCNRKGYVFLDTYNPDEYDPFLHHLKKSHYSKLAEMKDRPREAWTSTSLETDTKNSSRQDDKLPHHYQSSLVSSSPVTPSTRYGTPSTYSLSTSTKTPENKAMTRPLSRYPFCKGLEINSVSCLV
ncbi:protein FAM228A isoform X2 [Boleophthalmus pectinirostris]|uniref:protein FAM228A isoform X2 n=1 Tax=Boleophthalmus pectinirostris TaxID=150288 RepID=UPI0024309F05|nr:protein FAM228A isoform X2 [Boleophthalmus pectinirostris]